MTDAAPTSIRTVLETHTEDLDSPGACSCGWEPWDGTVTECRNAYRNHVAAYLKENEMRVDRLATAIFGPRTQVGGGPA